MVRARWRFSNPVNVAFHDGTVYVADFDNSKLRAINATTHVTTTVVLQQGFQRPFGMAFAPDGTFYVSTDNGPSGAHDPMSGTIWKIDVQGKKATMVATAIGRPRGMAMLGDGRIAVADLHAPRGRDRRPRDRQGDDDHRRVRRPGHGRGAGAVARSHAVLHRGAQRSCW